VAERHAGRVDPMTALIKHGVLLQSAHGPLPNVAEMIAGEPTVFLWVKPGVDGSGKRDGER